VIRAQQKEATRERVFATALRLFDQRGYEETSVEDIVRASKVARGTFYVHFPTKDDVLIELIRRSDAKICARMRASRAKRSLRAVLQATAKAFADSWRTRRALLPHAGAVAMRRIAGVAHERDVQPLRIELATQITAMRRELRAALPPQMLADVFLLDVFAALMAWAAAGAPSLDRVMAGVIDLFLRGAGRAVRSAR
jgi:AcrR family transcriptional regulator